MYGAPLYDMVLRVNSSLRPDPLLQAPFSSVPSDQKEKYVFVLSCLLSQASLFLSLSLSHIYIYSSLLILISLECTLFVFLDFLKQW